MSKAEYIAENNFHVTVALHHLRKINPDLLPPDQVDEYTNTLRSIEMLNVAIDELANTPPTSTAPRQVVGTPGWHPNGATVTHAELPGQEFKSCFYSKKELDRWLKVNNLPREGTIIDGVPLEPASGKGDLEVESITGSIKDSDGNG